MKSIYELPNPGRQEKEKSQALLQCLQDEITTQQAPLSFARFMELALYHPEYGYYFSDTIDIGSHGDFTTAPEITPLFAACLARQIRQINQAAGTNQILELGAGTGRLAKDLLLAMERDGCPPDAYYIHEPSPALCRKQKALLQADCASHFKHIIWLDALPAHFSGTIVANEVLDALPVDCFRIENQNILERRIASVENGLAWQLMQPTNHAFLKTVQALKTCYAFSTGYESEICSALEPFIQSLSSSLQKGVILLVDYGYGQREYYHPQRTKGTLTCFYQHRQHDNPLLFPGLQDITAHVDFTRVIDIAHDAGCTLDGFTTQAAFLLACGLTDLVAKAEQHLSAKELFALHHAVKLLTLPTEMGERVKVMALSKDLDIPLSGFALQDRRRDL